jgi:hypothetical protein
MIWNTTWTVRYPGRTKNSWIRSTVPGVSAKGTVDEMKASPEYKRRVAKRIGADAERLIVLSIDLVKQIG